MHEPIMMSKFAIIYCGEEERLSKEKIIQMNLFAQKFSKESVVNGNIIFTVISSPSVICEQSTKIIKVNFSAKTKISSSQKKLSKGKQIPGKLIRTIHKKALGTDFLVIVIDDINFFYKFANYFTERYLGSCVNWPKSEILAPAVLIIDIEKNSYDQAIGIKRQKIII